MTSKNELVVKLTTGEKLRCYVDGDRGGMFELTPLSLPPRVISLPGGGWLVPAALGSAWMSAQTDDELIEALWSSGVLQTTMARRNKPVLAKLAPVRVRSFTCLGCGKTAKKGNDEWRCEKCQRSPWSVDLPLEAGPHVEPRS